MDQTVTDAVNTCRECIHYIVSNNYCDEWGQPAGPSNAACQRFDNGIRSGKDFTPMVTVSIEERKKVREENKAATPQPDPKDRLLTRVAELYNRGDTINEMTRQLKISKERLYKLIHEARDKGLIVQLRNEQQAGVTPERTAMQVVS